MLKWESRSGSEMAYWPLLIYTFARARDREKLIWTIDRTVLQPEFDRSMGWEPQNPWIWGLKWSKMDIFGQFGAVPSRVAQDLSRSRTAKSQILARKGLRRTLLGNRGLDPFWTLWSHNGTI